MKAPDGALAIRTVEMNVKGNVVAVINVGAQALPTFAPLNLGEGSGLHQLKCADGDFE